jgi:hypothetical protein
VISLASVQTFASQAAAQRRELWPATVTLADNSVVSVAKSPTKISRIEQEQGAGFVQRAVATFSFDAGGTFVPDIGAKFTLTTAPIASEVDTVWKCFDLQRADACNTEHLARCYRAD